jgi:hypothetical protein
MKLGRMYVATSRGVGGREGEVSGREGEVGGRGGGGRERGVGGRVLAYCVCCMKI